MTVTSTPSNMADITNPSPHSWPQKLIWPHDPSHLRPLSSQLQSPGYETEDETHLCIH